METIGCWLFGNNRIFHLTGCNPMIIVPGRGWVKGANINVSFEIFKRWTTKRDTGIFLNNTFLYNYRLRLDKIWAYINRIYDLLNQKPIFWIKYPSIVGKTAFFQSEHFTVFKLAAFRVAKNILLPWTTRKYKKFLGILYPSLVVSTFCPPPGCFCYKRWVIRQRKASQRSEINRRIINDPTQNRTHQKRQLVLSRKKSPEHLLCAVWWIWWSCRRSRRC